ncbi:MAG: hypothetical protein J0M12_16420 [Deltaproteobacteria bacterium]|nr:hypothetical protein [Deltaproteobacteria bacterium]
MTDTKTTAPKAPYQSPRVSTQVLTVRAATSAQVGQLGQQSSSQQVLSGNYGANVSEQ